MKMFAALRKEDIEKARMAAQAAKEALDDPEVFAERMRTNPTFADLYQNDRRIPQLLAK